MNLSLYNGKYNPLYSDAVSNPNQKNYIDKKLHAAFYSTSTWKSLREKQLNEHPLCYMCSLENKIKEADTVDHCIVFTDRNDPIASDSNNLYSLCHSHHAKLHNKEQQYRDIWKKMYLKNSSIETIQKIASYKYKTTPEVSEDGYRL